jgi:hypothetical protein
MLATGNEAFVVVSSEKDVDNRHSGLVSEARACFAPLIEVG